MSNVMETANKEVIRLEILTLCNETGSCGAGVPVLKAALKKCGISLTDQELDLQINYLENKGLAKTHTVKNERLGICRKILFITAKGTDYLEGNLTDLTGV